MLLGFIVTMIGIITPIIKLTTSVTKLATVTDNLIEAVKESKDDRKYLNRKVNEHSVEIENLKKGR